MSGSPVSGVGVVPVEVVDHQPDGWYLLEDADGHYLDVHCSLPLVDVSILVRLDAAEEAELIGLGRTFVDYFAAKINHWSDRYSSRVVEGEVAREAQAAIARWQRR